MSWLRGLDSFSKLQEDVRIKTKAGAAVSCIAAIIMALLFFSELSIFLTTEQTNHLLIDTSRGEKLRINFDVTIPHISCSLLSIDVMDNSGAHQEDVDNTVHKKRIDKNGQTIGVPTRDFIANDIKKANATGQSLLPVVPKILKTKQAGYCGDCYGAGSTAGQCCNTCDQVKSAYRFKGWAFSSSRSVEQCIEEGVTDEQIIMSGEGCHVYGYLDVNKVAGNFHFSPGKTFAHNGMFLHDMQSMDPKGINISHDISQLSFGDHFPGIVNPLDHSVKSFDNGGGLYQYHIKIVRTTYQYISGQKVISNQYSVTEHHAKANQRGAPGVYFFYDLSPIMVQVTETRKPVFHFLTQLCAIIGGVFTVAGLFDRLVHFSVKQFDRKQTHKFS